MTEEQVPTIPITSPLQLFTLPFDVLQQAQFRMSLATVKAMSNNTNEAAATRQQEPAIRTVEPDRLMNRTNVKIHKSEKVLDERVPGHIDEIMVRSTSDFSIELLIDDQPVFHESITKLIDVTKGISSMVAIYSDGHYKFSITDLTYNHMFLRVFVNDGGTFDIFRKLRRDPYAD